VRDGGGGDTRRGMAARRWLDLAPTARVGQQWLAVGPQHFYFIYFIFGVSQQMFLVYSRCSSRQ
jgi:hypothetical protein